MTNIILGILGMLVIMEGPRVKHLWYSRNKLNTGYMGWYLKDNHLVVLGILIGLMHVHSILDMKHFCLPESVSHQISCTIKHYQKKVVASGKLYFYIK